jgi:exopolysaccharide biosynthesis polyprenyl glycosylphosphotransferase
MAIERQSNPMRQRSPAAPPVPRALPSAITTRPLTGLLAHLLQGSPWLALRVACDLLILTFGCVVGLLVAPAPSGAWLLVFFPPLALLFLYSRGRYLRSMRDAVLASLAPGFGAISISAMAIFMLQLLVVDDRSTISSVMAWTWLVSLTGVTVVGMTLTGIQQAARRRGIISNATLIIGADFNGLDMAERLKRHPEYGLRAVGFLDTCDQTELPDSAPPLLGDLEDLADITVTYGVRNVIIGFPDTPYRSLLALVSQCDQLSLETNVMPRLSGAMNRQTRFEYLGTVPLLNLRAVNPESWRFDLKHALDRVAALLLILVLSPLMAIIAIAVRLSSSGPVFFRQVRAGRDGRIFNLVKFRTMVGDETDIEYQCSPGLAPGGVEGVDRRTTVGRFLRRTSLDELPQLVNVVRGEMSIVGPRPERPEFAELFRREVERYQDRHRVRSGITGWAQVNGLRGQTPLVDRVELDNFYIEHWSLALDVKILLLTIPSLLRGS